MHINYVDSLTPQISYTEGTLGYERFFGGGSVKSPRAICWELSNGSTTTDPGSIPTSCTNSMRYCGYSVGDRTDGYSLTAMYYHGLWNATTDQPERAIEEGLIGRYGSLNPSDGGMAERASLTGRFLSPLPTANCTRAPIRSAIV